MSAIVTGAGAPLPTAALPAPAVPASWDRAVADVRAGTAPAPEAGSAAPAPAAPAPADAAAPGPAADATTSALPTSTVPAPQAAELPADAAAMFAAPAAGLRSAETTRDAAHGAEQGAGQPGVRAAGLDGAGARFSGSVPSAAEATTLAPTTASAGAGDVGGDRVQPDGRKAAGDAGAAGPSGTAQAGVGGSAGGPAAQGPGPWSPLLEPAAMPAAAAVLASGGQDGEAFLPASALPQGAASASGQDRTGPRAGPLRREPGAGRGRDSPAGGTGGAPATAGWGQGPIEDTHAVREQAGSLLAEGDARSGGAAALLDSLLPEAEGLFTAASVMDSPLWAWALGGVLGRQDGIPAWQRLDLSPTAFAATLRDTPWLVVGAQVGHAVWQADVMALQTLAGPLPDLLRLGVDPRTALTLQLGWEAALLGGQDPVSGHTLPPLWQSWSLEAPESLAALAGMAGAGASVAVPAHPAERPSAVAALLLGLLPVAQAVPEAVRDAVRLSPVAALLGPAGLGGLRRVEVGHGGAGIGGAGIGGAGIGGMIAVRGHAGEPVLLAGGREGGLHRPAGTGALILGGSAGAGASLALASGLAGPSPCVLASWQGSRDVAAVASLLAAALPLAPAGLLAAEWRLPLDGSSAWAQVVAQGGAALDPGLATPRSDEVFSGPARPPGVWRMLHLRADLRAPGRGDFDAHVSHGERRPVAIDLFPARPAAPCWRLDDTRSLVAVGTAGPQAASVRAAELYRSLLGGGATLDLLQPGEGLATWEGSPLWLGLAGIRKPASLGVALNGSVPARVEVLHLSDGTWHVEHAGGPYAAPRRRLHAADAAEGSALLTDVLYAVPESVAGALARRSSTGFASARARTLPARTPSPGVDPLQQDWRPQEAWAAVARDWARIAAASDEVAAVPAPGEEVVQAGRGLIDQAGGSGPLAGAGVTWDAFGSADAPATLSLILPGPAAEDGLAATLAGFTTIEAGGTIGSMAAGRPDAARSVAHAAVTASQPERQRRDQAPQDVGSMLWSQGEAILARVSGGLIGTVSRADGLALAVRLGRLRVDGLHPPSWSADSGSSSGTPNPEEGVA